MCITKTTITFTVSALLSLSAHSQKTPVSSPESLVPSSYKLLETIRGDLNKDGQEDVVLLVKTTDKDSFETDEEGKMVDRNRRGLIIAFKSGQTYRVALKHLKCFSSENEYGGGYFPPELDLQIKKGSLLINYSHGRYGYWSYNFRYQNASFDLIGYEHVSSQGPVIGSMISVNLLSNKALFRKNINEYADGGEEVFKETWKSIKTPRRIKLSEIDDFDEFSVLNAIGMSYY